GTEVAPRGTALATDPVTDNLYVDVGKEIEVLDSSGNVLEEEIGLNGPGKLNCPADYTTYSSRGVAIDATTNHLYASCFDTLFGGLIGTVREYGYELPKYEPVDNPALVHGVHHPEVHSWGDFQVTPDGAFAAFSTVVPLKAGFDNGGQYELYRYSGG